MKKRARNSGLKLSVEALETRNLLATLIAYDYFDSNSGLTSFNKSIGDFGGGGSQAFQVQQRGGAGALNPANSILDQTNAGTPADAVGIIKTTQTGKFFSMADTGTSTRTATWQFNTAGYNGLQVKVDLAAMGAFDTAGTGYNADSTKWEYSFDNSSWNPLFTSSLGGAITYNMELAGQTRNLSSSMVMSGAVGGNVTLNNNFQTLTGNVSGIGNSLYVRLSAMIDKRQGFLGLTSDVNEAAAADNIQITGDLIPPVQADSGVAYTVTEGNSLHVHANPVDFLLTGSGVNNGGLQKNELELNAQVAYPGVGNIGTLNINSSISGTMTADVKYTGGVLSEFQFRNSPIAVSNASSSINIIIAGVTLSLNGVSGYLTSTGPQTILSTSGANATIGMNNAVLVLNSGTASIVGTGLASSIAYNIDLSTDPAELPVDGLGVNTTLTVDGSNIGTLKYQIPNNTPILTFLTALLSPSDLAQITQYITGGTFGIDLTGTANLTNEITPPAWTYTWDVNGDGTFGDTTGKDSTLSWAQLQALGINDGPGTKNVYVRVTDGVNTSTSTAVTLTVVNAAPTAAIAAPALGLRSGGLNGNAVRGQGGLYVLTATDPSSVDQAANFTFNIDWNGDNISDQTVVGVSGTTVSHVFTTVGTYTIGVQAIDKDGGASGFTQSTTKIVDWDLRQNGGVVDLVVGGTTGDDGFNIFDAGANTVQLTDGLNFTVGGVTGGIVLYGQAGNDMVQSQSTKGLNMDGGDGADTYAIFNGGAQNYTFTGGAGNDFFAFLGGSNSALNIDTGADDDQLFIVSGSGLSGTLNGGDGSDVFSNDAVTTLTLNAGNGDDVVLAFAGTDTVNGGDGNDVLAGGRVNGGNGSDLIIGVGANDSLNGDDGNDVIVGNGGGGDTLNGGNGEDLILAANLTDWFFDSGDDNVSPGVVEVWLQWGTADPFATRVSQVQGGPGNIMSPASYLTTSPAHVLDDAAVDTVIGGGDSSPDFFFYKLAQDSAPDFNIGQGDVRVLLT